MTAIVLLIAATIAGLLFVIYRQQREIETLQTNIAAVSANVEYYRKRVEQLRRNTELYDSAANIPKSHPQKRPKSMTAKTVRRKKAE